MHTRLLERLLVYIMNQPINEEEKKGKEEEEEQDKNAEAMLTHQGQALANIISIRSRQSQRKIEKKRGIRKQKTTTVKCQPESMRGRK